jgi:DNA repair protein SbcD/Mre11
MKPIRVLFLADSHLGLDLPVKPRVERRRRGQDFLANHAAALAPALSGAVDVVVHGGDVFDRPGVAPVIAQHAYAPLLRVAERGVPVFIVPGNHERGRLPHARLLSHPNVHVFDRACTFVVEAGGLRIALAGFPFERRDVRGGFVELVDQTGWSAHRADVRLLCIHHCVEGATVGPGDFMFTTAAHVIRARDLPRDFAAVLSGHIHRHQVLTSDRWGRPLPAPVLYPGSIERTSTAEIGEAKGYMMLELTPDGACGRVRWEFHGLPARPMLVTTLVAGPADKLERAVRGVIESAPDDAVLVIRIQGALTDAHLRIISPVHLRSLTPATMNVEIRAEDLQRFTRRRVPRAPATTVSSREENLQLDL